MKTMKIYLIILCLVCSVSSFATHNSLNDRTGKWLQDNTANHAFGSGSLRGSGTPPKITDETGDPSNPSVLDSPVGDACIWTIGLGLAYGCFVARRKSNIINI
jgi:hypothetical protein